jgi:hypothetical protein
MIAGLDERGLTVASELDLEAAMFSATCGSCGCSEVELNCVGSLVTVRSGEGRYERGALEATYPLASICISTSMLPEDVVLVSKFDVDRSSRQMMCWMRY